MSDIRDHDVAAEYLAKILCLLNGMAPVEPGDGGANWFAFYNDAMPVVESLRKRGFKFEGVPGVDRRKP